MSDAELSSLHRRHARSIWKTAFWLLLGSSLMTHGCQNARIKYDNKEIRRVALEELVRNPPEKARWVEVAGTLLADSAVVDGATSYVILMDSNSRMAAFVRVAKDVRLVDDAGAIVTVRGMARPVEHDKPLSANNVPQGVMLGNLVIEQNEIPPGWWSSEFLILVGFILFGGPDPREK